MPVITLEKDFSQAQPEPTIDDDYRNAGENSPSDISPSSDKTSSPSPSSSSSSSLSISSLLSTIINFLNFKENSRQGYINIGLLILLISLIWLLFWQ